MLNPLLPVEAELIDLLLSGLSSSGTGDSESDIGAGEGTGSLRTDVSPSSEIVTTGGSGEERFKESQRRAGVETDRLSRESTISGVLAFVRDRVGVPGSAES